jgi:glutamate synthase (NADPH/NADH) large chain
MQRTRRIAQEFDSCAVYAAVLKNPAARSAVPLWVAALEALQAMEHRAGYLNGKSDGTGLLVSAPRHVWERRLAADNLRPATTFLSLSIAIAEEHAAQERLKALLSSEGFVLLAGHWDVVDGAEGIWTVALADERRHRDGTETPDWEILERLASSFPGQIAAWGPHVSALKVRGDSRALARHGRRLWGDAFYPRVVVGHNRFSTNTTTQLHRVQPFLSLAHNGEINTIGRARRELSGLGFDPIDAGSDSQTMDYALCQLSARYHLTLAETMRMLSAPSPAIVSTWPLPWQEAFARLQLFWQPVVQGPHALVATNGSELVAAVDAMGLRPLWIVETSEAVVLSSEVGVVPPDVWIAEPRMIGAGEVVAWSWQDQGPLTTLRTEDIEASLLSRVANSPWPKTLPAPPSDTRATLPVQAWQSTADGWTRDDLQMVKAWVETGQEPVGSLGFDSPLAALSSGVVTISDYLQETVAVVTNPALDREREGEHFHLTTWIGGRPSRLEGAPEGPVIRLDHPWLQDSELESLQQVFRGRTSVLNLFWEQGKRELDAAREVGRQAVAAIKAGASLLILDDGGAYQRRQSLALDPTLAVAAVEQELQQTGMRRRTSLVVRSGMIRNLHDAAVLLGLGADALVPYALWRAAGPRLSIQVLNHGLEKILSTMGTHWLAGYGRNFSSIGLPEDIAALLEIPTYAAPPLETWERRREHIREIRLDLIESDAQPRFLPHFNTRVYKVVHQLVSGSMQTDQFHQAMADLERQMPQQIRHTLAFRRHGVRPAASVSLAAGGHSYPFVIASMSFGSQGESAFRAYAEAAKRLNIIAMNGEGGELPDMVGQYVPWRGYQVASGRFGINAALLQGASYVEIKIGQGAKPGEGGHLPGRKVSVEVARARHAQVGIDLISPSNNHDLYSIEDLRQLIDELKTVNPHLQVVVKVPVVPNIGTIAVGIVKAGADVINLSGFDGGTGAARMHALRHVGLPSDIGVPLVHQALVSAGVRHAVEIWADGGVRTADDVLKLILLGANRIGFGTMAMTALGCTICRHCQQDTCHVGIATQVRSVEEARERGLKRFQPQEMESAVENLVAFFRGLAVHLEERMRHLGAASVAEAVGRWQWLSQWGAHELLDFMPWLESLAEDNQALLVSEVAGPSWAVAVQADSKERRNAAHTPSTGRRMAGVLQSSRRLGLQSFSEQVRFDGVAGQGFGAFLTEGVTCLAVGGAQDGVGKGASGGHIWVMKRGRWGGHAGKSLAYGAQAGVVVVQGAADARAGVRLAGAQVVILADGVPSPVQSRSGWDSASIKGFGFEYMTRGEALVLGDPGPWLAAGMTGGVIYLRHDPAQGLTRSFLQSRLARSAKVSIESLAPEDSRAVADLLQQARSALHASGQEDRAAGIMELEADLDRNFVKVVPLREQMDQEISTE